ncbi:MAG TPA: thiamine pyrophosphate-requiring protein [Beijerinckiaceae bacterium]|nr:thiamine pyrophosphate-requiring protein [Beijerinckiaceae bacterium]
MSGSPETVAGVSLALLAARGVEVLFGNGGTDFAPIIEAYAEAAQKGTPVPRPIIATHENLAVTMAHGYGMVSRKIPAVMVHVSVGTANMVCPAMNAARENVGILLTAGRSPLTEAGLPGSRDGYIHWSQEMYDQAGLIREFVKWDYELRNGAQLETVVERALAIAASEPCGPVYLSLPREVLAEKPAPDASPAPRLRAAAPAAPDRHAIETAAELLATARRPLVIAANAGRDPGAFAALAAFAERFAIPVAQHKPRYLALPSSHPMNLGYDPMRLVGDADVIMVLESDAPWLPVKAAPPPSCKVIQCGFDPLFSRIPLRGFPCDLGIVGGTAAILSELSSALEGRVDGERVRQRRAATETQRRALAAEWEAERQGAARQAPIHPAWASHCLDRAKDLDAIVVNEYTLQLEHFGFEQADSYFGSSSASGLGWGAGAALGAKLAAPGRQVVAVLGDGAYLFSNPSRCTMRRRCTGCPCCSSS